jgi:AraC-like DNA-binding protein
MFSDKVIRVGGAAALLTLLDEHGVDFGALATEAGLSAAVFANSDNVVPYAALCRLLHLAEERTGLSDIGLRTCVGAGLASLGRIGYLVANSATVERGLAALQAYFHVHDQGAAPLVRGSEGMASLGYEILAPTRPGADQMTFGALAIGMNVLRALCGPDFCPLQVAFTFARPRNVSLFRTFFGAPICFGAAANEIVFDARWLARPIATADAYLYAVLADDVRRDADRVDEPADERVQRVVRSLVAGGRFSADAAADAFGVTRRTLARRLRDRGTTFRAVLDEARYVEARRLLQSSSISITEIADRLGYADTATFTRAFHRWCGTSPRRWQAANQPL